jgi:hypothetical protein
MLEILDNFTFIPLEHITNDQKLSVDSNRALHKYIQSFTATPPYSVSSHNWFDTNIQVGIPYLACSLGPSVYIEKLKNG